MRLKKALKEEQRKKPVYSGGADKWWTEVIKRTALDAGAETQKVNKSLDEIVRVLLKHFSGREGYRAFNDALPALETLNQRGIRTGLVSNADIRMKNIMADLGLAKYLDPVIISEEEGIEKPTLSIWEHACSRGNASPQETVHVGDEMLCDYIGSQRAGIHPFLLRRPGPEGKGERKEPDEDLTGVRAVPNLEEVVQWILDRNREYK